MKTSKQEFFRVMSGLQSCMAVKPWCLREKEMGILRRTERTTVIAVYDGYST